MKNVQQMILFSITALVVSCSVADEAFREGASLAFNKSVESYAPNYSRISANVGLIAFWVDVLKEPVVWEEWKLSGPKYKWTITPSKSGVNRPAQMDSPKVEFAFDKNKDFGKSYDIHCVVEWIATDKSGREVVSRTAYDFAIDAIEYFFEMKCAEDGVSAVKGAHLVDNRSAVVDVVANGCRKSDLLALSFASFPVSTCPQNEVNDFSMQFIRKKKSLHFDVPKTYWYGEPEPNCCWESVNEYRVVLRSDGEPVCARDISVGMPIEEPEEIETFVDFPEVLSFQVSTTQSGDVFVDVALKGFKKSTKFSGNCTTQYKEKMAQEEEYHRKQYMNEVDLEKGGAQGLYSVETAVGATGIRMTKEGDKYRFFANKGESQTDFVTRLAMKLVKAFDKEIEDSTKVWNNNRAYQELKAKEAVGYKEAYRYHCTYMKSNLPDASAPVLHTRDSLNSEVGQ